MKNSLKIMALGGVLLGSSLFGDATALPTGYLNTAYTTTIDADSLGTDGDYRYVDIKLGFNNDAVLNDGNTSNTNTDHKDADADIDNAGGAFFTQSYESGNNDANGLPDDAIFDATDYHKILKLAYSNDDDGYNSIGLTATVNDDGIAVADYEQSLITFDIENHQYDYVYIYATSGTTTSKLNVKFHYTDGTADATELTVPDWFDEITEDENRFYVVNGLDRYDKDTNGKDNPPSFHNVDDPAIFGFKYTVPDTDKTVDKIELLVTHDVIEDANGVKHASKLSIFGINISDDALPGNFGYAYKSADSNKPSWLSGDKLTLSGTPDAKGDNSFNVTFKSLGGGDDVTKSYTLFVNDTPVITEGASVSKTTDEDTALTFTLNATDADDDTITWSISSGASHGSVSVSGTGASKEMTYTPTTNYNGSDSFVVTVTDGHTLSNTTVSMTINAVNDVPTDIALTNASVNQGDGDDATVGTLSNTDVEADTYTYTLVSGDGATNNDKFSISGTTLTVNEPSKMDAGDYSIRVNVNDGTDDYAEAFTITIVDATNPVITTSDSLNMIDATTTVVTMAGTDNADLTWSIAGSSNDNDDFEIDSSTGALTLKNASNKTNKGSYTVTVTLSDGSNDVTKTLTVTVQEPLILNYQGFLSNADGAVDETLSMTFKLYDALTNGNEVWTTTRDIVISKGIYNVDLGKKVMLNDLGLLDNTYYLGVTIGSNSEMTPRQTIKPSGYTKLLLDKIEALHPPK